MTSRDLIVAEVSGLARRSEMRRERPGVGGAYKAEVFEERSNPN